MRKLQTTIAKVVCSCVPEVLLGRTGRIFSMTKGMKVDLETLRGYFSKKHNAPPGLGVYTTPNENLNDETWRKIDPTLCKGICMMPVVIYYPDW